MKIRLTESQLKHILSESIKKILERKSESSDTYIWKLSDGEWDLGEEPDEDAIEVHRLNLMGEDALECWLKGRDPERNGFYGREDIPDDEMWEILVDPQFNYLDEENGEALLESEEKYLKDSNGKCWKTEKNEKVPAKCPKCGAAMHLKIQGEPVFICDHGHYSGTLKFE